jgi:hypothetical protein
MLDVLHEEASEANQIDPPVVINKAIERLGSAPTNKALKRALLAYWNDLIRGGMVGFGDGNGEWKTATCFVTEEGKETLQHASRDPINYNGYLAYLDQEVSLDPIARGYVEEALNTYRACCYKATAVLIGAAVERLVLDLRDELLPRLKARNIQVPKGLDAWQVKTVLEAAAKQLLADLDREAKRTKDDDLRKLLDNAQARLQPVAAEFRKTRNEAGHPASLDPVHPADIHANLLLFPTTAKLFAQLKEWVLKYYV